MNDSLSSQDTVRVLRPRLLMHASQHGQQRLLQPAFQGRLVDDWMRRDDLLEQRDALLRQWRDVESRLQTVRVKMRELGDRRELLELHRHAIDKVKPQPGEEEHLEGLRQELRSRETARKHYDRALSALHDHDAPGLLTHLGVLEQSLEMLSQTDPDLETDREAVSQFRMLAQELERRLRRPPLPGAAYDADELEARLYELAQLKRKLRRTLPEILSLREEIDENLMFLDSCGLDIKQLEKTGNELRAQLAALLRIVNDARRQAGESFAHSLEKELVGLGFSEHVRIIPEYEASELVPGCLEDRVRFLWAPNPGQNPQPLDRIASGGELSRFLLGVASLNAHHDDATLIFDEVDAGVGGITLNRVADRLAQLAGQRQMLLITHWPQLATRAQRHFQVSKTIQDGKTFTLCAHLDDAARKEELDRMAGIEA
jgi:DNA repair protein RecN (Recombination protein N)